MASRMVLSRESDGLARIECLDCGGSIAVEAPTAVRIWGALAHVHVCPLVPAVAS